MIRANARVAVATAFDLVGGFARSVGTFVQYVVAASS